MAVKNSTKRRNKTRAADFIDMVEVKPLTPTQEKVFETDKNLVLYGSAGSGKSFLACYLGFEAIRDRDKDRLIIIRSAVPTREIGFLPGTDKEKARVYEEPYHAICAELMDRGDAYDILKHNGIIAFMTTSYIRGITLRDATIVVDECQNMTFQELDSLITRIGDNCKIIFCGDFKQADLKANGMIEFLKIVSTMEEFDLLEFTLDDIVRSGLVKNYLVAKDRIQK